MTARSKCDPVALFGRNLQFGAWLGVAAYVLGYLATFGAMRVDDVETYGVPAPFWKMAGWTFYGTHRVKLAVTEGGDSAAGALFAASIRELSELTSTVPTVVYQLIPMVFLMAAGFVLFYRSPAAPIRAKATGAIGASVVASYLPLALLGRFVFAHTHTVTFESGNTLTTTLGAELFGSVFLTGLLYPLVFGALGALCAQHLEYTRRAG